ncbi:hypothetical protein M407DRAFT_241254 [Tulasnella calospora MUT 4182]|uniref:Uncharacterized protein n=1 Tax=Tulasnella calospora MUT 4182 TaxID=1051891 RepID=A0A0C3MGE0_9AGAM|nr:hypothetical protein M407DRAFT_241254 [Tulasnella calospora MUT 4182]
MSDLFPIFIQLQRTAALLSGMFSDWLPPFRLSVPPSNDSIRTTHIGFDVVIPAFGAYECGSGSRNGG